MSIERASGDFAKAPEVLPTVQDVRFMSANIIDAIGVQRDSDRGSLFDADWTDEVTGLTFNLQRKRKDAHTRTFVYNLYIYEQFSNRDQYQRFLYETHSKHIDTYVESYVTTNQRTKGQRLFDLANYLETAPVGITPIDDDFDGIIEVSEFKHDPLRSKRLQYVVRRVIDKF